LPLALRRFARFIQESPSATPRTVARATLASLARILIQITQNMIQSKSARQTGVV
jgi:hypothetical protein